MNEFLTVNGYECEIFLTDMGHYCGYVIGNFKESVVDQIDCHGGVTYHRADKFGFDCAHAGDFIPTLGSRIEDYSATFKDRDFVIQELESITKQLDQLKADGVDLYSSEEGQSE